jgi:flagellar hook-length control protein FliK
MPREARPADRVSAQVESAPPPRQTPELGPSPSGASTRQMEAPAQSGGQAVQAMPVAAGDRPQIFAAPLNRAATAQGSEPSAETADRLVQAIRLQWTRGGGEAHVQIAPKHFGSLTLSVRVEGQVVVARVQAETAAVRAWLQANEAGLRDALVAHDLTLERLEIAEPADDQARTQDDRARREPSADSRPRRRARPKAGARFEVIA